MVRKRTLNLFLSTMTALTCMQLPVSAIAEEPDTNAVSEGNGSSETLTWEVTSGAESSGSVQFQTEVVQGDENEKTVNNWDRTDPILSYTVTKESDPVSGTTISYGQEVVYNLIVKNTGEYTVHNIVVVDPIPENSEFTWINHNYNGEYIEDGTYKYAKFRISELPVSGVAKLQFKVKVTKELKGTETAELINVAKYQNFNPGSTIPEDKEIIEHGIETNKTIHPLVGVQIDALKSSSPVDGSNVSAGDTIEYRVKFANTTPAYQVITGAQPLENPTTYKAGSDFTYTYDSNDQGVYTLSNVVVNADEVDRVTVNYVGSRMHVNTSKVDTNIWTVSEGTTSVTLTPKNVATNGFPTKAQVVSALNSLSWTMDELHLLNGSGNQIAADSDIVLDGDPGQLKKAVPDGYYVKSFRVTTANNSKAQVVFGSITADYTQDTYYNFGNYVSMGGYVGRVHTYAGNDGNYKRVSLYLTAYKTSADEELISVGMEKAYTVKYGDATDMSSATSNLHITDEIPSYMTYVQNSAYLRRNDVTESIITNGAKFDVRYSQDGGYYYLDNINVGSVSRFNTVYVDYPSNLSLTYTDTATGSSGSTTTITKEGITNASDLTTYLKSLKFYGSVGQSSLGSIRVRLRYYSSTTEKVGEFESETYSCQFNSYMTNLYDAEKSFTALVSGYYQLEAYGGRAATDDGKLSRGGYASGAVWLNEGETIYVQVGYNSWSNMGDESPNYGYPYFRYSYNGGGRNLTQGYAQGAGATSFTTSSGPEIQNFSSKQGDVLLVAGGAGVNGAGGTGGGNGFGKGWSGKNNHGGGGGWSGGTAAQGGTNHIAASHNGKNITNTSSRSGASGESSAKITYMGTDANNLSAQKAIKTKTTTIDEWNFDSSTALPTSSGTFGTCEYKKIDGKPSIECVANDVEVGKNVELVFKATIDKTVPSSVGSVENTAFYDTSFSKYTSLSGKKAETATNTVIHYLESNQPVISAVKSANPESGTTVSKGSDITYTLKFTNSGSSTAKYVHVRDYIPEHTSYAGFVSTGGAYVSNENGSYVEWVLENIKPNETKTVSFTVRVNDNTTSADTIYNTALYELKTNDPGEPGTIDGDPKDKSNQTVHPLANRENPDEVSSSVSKTANPVTESYVHRQDEIEYTLTVQNLGTGLQDFVLVEDKIPEGTTFKEIKAYTGGTSSSTLSVRSYYNETEKAVKYVVCDLANLDSVELHFVVTVDKECMVDEIDNQAKYRTLRYSSTSADTDKIEELNLTDKDVVDFPSIYNDGKAKETEVTKHYLYQPNVNVVKSSNPETDTVVGRGSKITYTLTVTNDGDDMANYVNIEDFIPQNTAYVKTSATTELDTDKVGTVTEDGDVKSIQWVLYDLAAGETRTVSFSVTVNHNAQSGVFIDNVAYYENYETDHGKPNTDEFVNPDKETNKTRHTVELTDDLILTGGSGWNNYLPFIGGGVLVLALAIFLITKKKKKDDETDASDSNE